MHVHINMYIVRNGAGYCYLYNSYWKLCFGLQRSVIMMALVNLLIFPPGLYTNYCLSHSMISTYIGLACCHTVGKLEGLRIFMTIHRVTKIFTHENSYPTTAILYTWRELARLKIRTVKIIHKHHWSTSWKLAPPNIYSLLWLWCLPIAIYTNAMWFDSLLAPDGT